MTYSEFKAVAWPADKHEIDPYLSRVYRAASLPITWTIYRTGITPNKITLIQIFVGLAACMTIFCWSGTLGFLVGVILLHVAYVLDCVDGELARINGQQSVSGVFLDKYSHAVIMQAMFLAVGTHMADGLNSLVSTTVICASWAASFASFIPSNRLLLTTVDAMIRRDHHKQYSLSNYYKAEPKIGMNTLETNFLPISRQEQLLNDLENIFGDKISLLPKLHIFRLAKHCFRHVSYLLGMTFLLVLELFDVSNTLILILWTSGCIIIACKELILVRLILKKSLILDRIRLYEEKLGKANQSRSK